MPAGGLLLDKGKRREKRSHYNGDRNGEESIRTLALGNRLLLVDGDFRRPCLHRTYGVQNNTGLTNLLRGTTSLDEACQPVTDDLTVLTSGSFVFDPQELLQADRILAVLSEMRNKFDLVIIDSAPVLVVADTLLLAPHVDGVLLVMRYGLVKDVEAAEARHRLEKSRAKILGGILNYCEDRAPMTDYRYYRVTSADPEVRGTLVEAGESKMETFSGGQIKQRE